MRTAYPAWAHVMPIASQSHDILIVLVAAAVGAISSVVVVLTFAHDPQTATKSPSTSVQAIVVPDRSKNEQMPQLKIEQMPQTVPDVTGSGRAAAPADGGRQIMLPDERKAKDDLPVATQRHVYWRRVRRFPTPNHW